MEKIEKLKWGFKTLWNGKEDNLWVFASDEVEAKVCAEEMCNLSCDEIIAGPVLLTK